MRAAVIHAAEDIRIEDVPEPRVRESTDAVVRVTHACICGSDLWAYQGVAHRQAGQRIGHEFVGVIESVGDAVTALKPGDQVVAPFVWSDGTCVYCREGLYTSCVHGGFWGEPGSDGGQGEAVRVPYAEGTLVKLPSGLDDQELVKVLTLSDRAEVAKRFGATDIVPQRGEEAIAAVKELTKGEGAHAVLEAVGTEQAMRTSVSIARDGGNVGFVGVPHGGSKGVDIGQMFGRNVSLRGGVAPARRYIPSLLADVLDGKLDPSLVFDMRVGLDGVPEGYAAMNNRTALKVLVCPASLAGVVV